MVAVTIGLSCDECLSVSCTRERKFVRVEYLRHGVFGVIVSEVCSSECAVNYKPECHALVV